MIKLSSRQNIFLEREMAYPTNTSTKMNMTRFDIKPVLYSMASLRLNVEVDQ